MIGAVFSGGGATGLEFMKFTLTYDGDLPSNGGKKVKWNIRKHIHPQLEELWRIDQTLLQAERHRLIPENQGFFRMDVHHSLDDLRNPTQPPPAPYLDLCAEFSKGGRKFKPLVRNSFNLKCGLKIQFLRKEPPGKIYQGGDLDNRLKTLFDALQMPDDQQVISDPTISDPVYCLLENDALIQSCDINTHQLLSKPNASPHEVHLLIEVDVRVNQPRNYNQIFLGG